MKTTQIWFYAAVMLSGTVALAQDDPATDDTAPAADPYMDEAAPMEEPVDVDVDVEAPAAPEPAPTVVTPIIIEGEEEARAEQPTGNLFGFGRRENFGGAIAEVKVGLGGGDYTEDNIQEQTSAGTTWDVRGVFGGHTPIGLEAAYVGSSRNVDNPPGATGDTQLVSNGVEGDLRLAIPIQAGEFVDVRPFAFGGIGWQYMSLWGDGSVDEDRDEGDHIMVVPAGLGVELGVGPVNLEARGTYRHAVGSDLFGEADADFDDPDALHSYVIGGAIGLEF